MILRQKTTGALFIATPTLIARRDMETYDSEIAQKRIDATKKKLAEIEAARSAPIQQSESVAKMLEDSKLLAELEQKVRERPAQIVAEAEAQAKTRADRIDEDLEVRKIRVMTSKAEVQEYALINFGVEFKPDMHLKEMKRLAVEERTKIIFANG